MTYNFIAMAGVIIGTGGAAVPVVAVAGLVAFVNYKNIKDHDQAQQLATDIKGLNSLSEGKQTVIVDDTNKLATNISVILQQLQ